METHIAVTGLEYFDHGGAPVTISMTVHPTLQMSAFFQPVTVCCCLMTSGAIHLQSTTAHRGLSTRGCREPVAMKQWPTYMGVPLMPVAVSDLWPTLLEAPKSASLTVPSLATKMLAPWKQTHGMAWHNVIYCEEFSD